MKIDFEMLERMEAAGAPAKAIIAYLRTHFEREEAKKIVKRPKDAKRKRERLAATKGGNVATASDRERLEATASDAPRARLFREGSAALGALNIKESRARSLIASWLKMTHDDEQLVTATILKARDLGAADAPGWILAALQQATSTHNGQRPNNNGTPSAPRSGATGQDAILAGMGRLADRVRARGDAERRERAASEDGDLAEGDDARLL